MSGGILFYKTMDSKKIYLTKAGLQDLQKEHDVLVNARRPQVLSRVTEALNMGDLSENAEYAAAREELSFIDGRIEELDELLKQVEVIADGNGKGKKAVDLGTKVTLKVKGKQEIFTVVGEWEADPREKKISHESPLGKALMGRKVGDEVEVEAPAGKILYNVIAIH